MLIMTMFRRSLIMHYAFLILNCLRKRDGMKKKRYQLIFAVVGLMLGFMLAHQFRSTMEYEQGEAAKTIRGLSDEITQMQKEHESLKTQISYLRASLDSVTPIDSELRETLELAKVEAGIFELTGPGVEVTLNDSSINVRAGDNPSLYLLHDEDILLILNELRAAGAEAISINGQRIMATTEVRCAGPTILLNQSKRLTPPYIILAIGDPESLEASLKMKGGIAQSLQIFGIQVSVKKTTGIVVPAYSGAMSFEYAQAAES